MYYFNRHVEQMNGDIKNRHSPRLLILRFHLNDRPFSALYEKQGGLARFWSELFGQKGS